MDWGSFIAISALIPVIGAASAWLSKLWANLILQRDRARYQAQMDALLQDLRTRDGKELLVHRLQFEKESGIYTQLWRAVLTLTRSAREFRMLQSSQPEPAENVMKGFCDAYNRLSGIIHDNRPFYCPTVFAKGKEILNCAGDVRAFVQKQSILENHGRYSDRQVEKLVEVDTHIEESLDKINSGIQPLCDAIGARIWSTKASGWDRPQSEENAPVAKE